MIKTEVHFCNSHLCPFSKASDGRVLTGPLLLHLQKQPLDRPIWTPQKSGEMSCFDFWTPMPLVELVCASFWSTFEMKVNIQSSYFNLVS